MVEASLVGSAALSGAVLLAIFLALAATRHRHPTLIGEGGTGSGYGYDRAGDIKGWAGTTNGLFTAFILLTLGIGAATIGFLQGGGLWLIAGGLSAGIGVVLSAYAIGRNAGIGSAGATLVTAAMIGLIIVLVVSAELMQG